MNFITKEVDSEELPEEPSKTLFVEDGNALFYSIKSQKTFEEVSKSLFCMATAGNRDNVVFSTDSYNKDSVKSMERLRRGAGEKYVIQGTRTRRPENWPSFLKSDDNKVQLINILQRSWPPTSNVKNKNVILINAGQAFDVDSGSEITELYSNQEETDSRVVVYCQYAATSGYDTAVVRSPDSDVFFILLHFASTIPVKILFETGTGNKKRILNITQLSKDLSPKRCNALLGVHAFTRCDSTSCFKGKGKVNPIKLIQANPRLEEIFTHVG